MSVKLGIIGGGVMAEAILSRLLSQNIYAANTVVVSDPLQQRRDYLQKTYGVEVTENNAVVFAANVILLAIKPQVLDRVAADLSGTANSSNLLLSILAGVPLKRLQAAFPACAVIRAMPNTPATVGAGMTAIAPSSQVSPQQIDRAKTIFAAVGEVVEVSESLMDAVTGLSGSGPAYVALLVEALADGGVAAGLPRAIASQLALQTVLGTAKLLQETELHPAQLKDRVTSPGGTTIAGVAALEAGGFRAAAIAAVKAACDRSRELGN
ncbi:MULTISPECIES: pyrroline-5-carboxylate reductase [Spirulina sp. CCY15215]|uniref:pyrroline-5-carboxylate reductase n=1 Tax=Spirulina sp. CCY15215 TaxID=2767591 RepID=UPI0032AF78CA